MLVLALLACSHDPPTLTTRESPRPEGVADDVDPETPPEPDVPVDTGEPPPDGDPIDGGAYLFSHEMVHDIEIDLDDDAWDQLEADKDNEVEAVVTVDGESLVAGVHRRGSSTLRNMNGKASFKVDFGQWDESQDFHGVRHFALTNMLFDATMMHEHLAYYLYGQLGVPAPRHGYARVTVNGELFGLYGIVESMDQRFVDRHWGWDRDGWMYDSLFTFADVTSAKVGYFSVQEEGTEGEAFDDLHALTSAVESTGGWELLGRWFDRDTFLKQQGASIAMAHYDSYWYNSNNFLLYHAPRSDKWHMIPWGQDETFAAGGGIRGPYNGAIVARCAGDSECREALEDATREAAHALVDLDLAGYAAETWALIGEDCEEDPRRELSCRPDDLYDFLAKRPQDVFDALGE